MRMRDNLKSNSRKKPTFRICLKLSAFTLAASQRRAISRAGSGGVYRDRGRAVAGSGLKKREPRARSGRAARENSTDPVYGKDRLFAGDAVLDEIGVLQAREFDGETVLDMAHHAALRLADHDHGSDRRAQIRCDRNRGARLRQVDDPAGDVDAV